MTTEVKNYIDLYCFYCPDLSSSLTPESCDKRRMLPINKKCHSCKTYELRWEGVMSISPNTVKETAETLSLFNNLEDAAKQLRITVQGLMYRIKKSSTLEEIAVSKGLYTPRKNIKTIDTKELEAETKPKEQTEKEVTKKLKGGIEVSIKFTVDSLSQVQEIIKQLSA